MSLSRKNWSALSSLTRQWTVEDEEEVERERRRKTRDPSTSLDPDDGEVRQERTGSTQELAEKEETGELAQLQMDFVEMLRVRDERRRNRHVEILQHQRKEGEEWPGEARVDVLGDVREDTAIRRTLASRDTPTGPASIRAQQEDLDPASGPTSSSGSSRKFVSSLSISFDKSPTCPAETGSPGGPDAFYTSSIRLPLSPTQNGDVQNGTAANFEPAAKPAFARQSSRTASFRMLRKKEEQTVPLQRSASVRVASKKLDSSKMSNPEEDQPSSFQRNSRQRLSSRSIQEKMEKLAQAAQKWEAVKSPTVPHKAVFMADEVSRIRNIFEKEPTSGEGHPADHRNLSPGISERINRWVQNKSSFSNSVDLRHVDILSKKTAFEKGDDKSPVSPSPHGRAHK
ncbi:ladinin-1 [Denticeps clupeoides]|uniref:ladinin-1 n=1 Tax=Denticeps clupeoides TaxID=299321 RepID=UPI0010A51771|nr:ladinin-1 [Denticeps clupeoides]